MNDLNLDGGNLHSRTEATVPERRFTLSGKLCFYSLLLSTAKGCSTQEFAEAGLSLGPVSYAA